MTGWLFQANISPTKPISIHRPAVAAPYAACILENHEGVAQHHLKSYSCTHRKGPTLQRKRPGIFFPLRVSLPRRNPCSVGPGYFLPALKTNRPTCPNACLHEVIREYTVRRIMKVVADGNIWFAWQLARVNWFSWS